MNCDLVQAVCAANVLTCLQTPLSRSSKNEIFGAIFVFICGQPRQSDGECSFAKKYDARFAFSGSRVAIAGQHGF